VTLLERSYRCGVSESRSPQRCGDAEAPQARRGPAGASRSLWYWQVVPCTAAAVAGPLITVAQHLIGTPDVRLGGLSLAQLVRGLLCAALLLSLLLFNRLRLLDHPMIRPLLFLSGYAMVTVLVGPHPRENVVLAIRLTFASLVFANAFHLGNTGLLGERWLVHVAWCVLLFMVVSLVIGLATQHTAAMYGSSYATAGLIDQPALTAALILSTLPIFLRSFPIRHHSAAGALLVLVALSATMRRTELSAAVAAIVLVLLRYADPFRRRACSRAITATVVGLAILVLAGAWTQAGTDLTARFQELDPRVGTGSGRYLFWSISLEHILERSAAAQIWGDGMGSFEDIADKHLGQGVGTHNDWLGFTHALGLIGLAGLVWWYVNLVRFTSYLRTAADGLFQGALSVLVVFALISFGQGGFYDPALTVMYAGLGFWVGKTSYWS